MTYISGRFEITYSGAIPAGVSKEKAVAVLHDHTAYLKATSSYREHSDLAGEGSGEKMPAEVKARAVDGAVHALTVRNEVPNPVFDSNVTTTYTFVNLNDGLWYWASSPMGVQNEGLWTVKDGANGLELAVSVQVDCNMMLKPVVKGQVQSGSEEIHKNMVQLMQG